MDFTKEQKARLLKENYKIIERYGNEIAIAPNVRKEGWRYYETEEAIIDPLQRRAFTSHAWGRGPYSWTFEHAQTVAAELWG